MKYTQQLKITKLYYFSWLLRVESWEWLSWVVLITVWEEWSSCQWRSHQWLWLRSHLKTQLGSTPFSAHSQGCWQATDTHGFLDWGPQFLPGCWPDTGQFLSSLPHRPLYREQNGSPGSGSPGSWLPLERVIWEKMGTQNRSCNLFKT